MGHASVIANPLDPSVGNAVRFGIFDIDDTTNVFMEEYRKWLHTRFPLLAADEDVHDLLINRFIRETEPAVLRATPGAREALDTLVEHCVPLALSARDEDLYRHTYALLEHHFPQVYEPENVVLIGHHNGKPLTSKLRALEDRGIVPSFIVEDNHTTAVEFALAGIPSFYIGPVEDGPPLMKRFKEYERAWDAIATYATSD